MRQFPGGSEWIIQRMEDEIRRAVLNWVSECETRSLALRFRPRRK